MLVKEIECKGILGKSGLADYALNCYTGCQHGCRYCYARFMGRFVDNPPQADLPWGGFVHVKVNAPEVLKRQVQRTELTRPRRVFVSSVCDGWQPLEEKYQLTRQCLLTLLEKGFHITILTKSHLVIRDLDIISRRKDLVDLGVTITTLDEKLAKKIEPGAPSPEKRLRVLEEARKKGITTYAFLGPLMPHLSDTEENIQSLFKTLKPLCLSYLYVDILNPRWGVWPSMKGLLEENYPPSTTLIGGSANFAKRTGESASLCGGLSGGLVEEYRKMLFHGPSRRAYTLRFEGLVQRLAQRHGYRERLRFCF